MVNQTILDLLNILLLYEKIIIITCSSTRHYKNSSCSVAVMSKFFSPMDWRISGFPVVHHFPEITKLMSIESVMPSNHFILCRPLLLLPSIFSSIRVFSNESVSCVTWSKYWSFNISSSNEYSELTSWSPCNPRDSQESSPAPQFERIKSLMLSLLYSPTLSSTYDYWKKHSFVYMDFCQWSNCSLIHCLHLSKLSFQGATVFWFHGCSHHEQWFWGSRK